MQELQQLTNAYERASSDYRRLIETGTDGQLHQHDKFGDGINEITLGDNLEYMLQLLLKKDMAGKLQLVYIDPPFFSREKYMSSMKLHSEKLGDSPVLRIGAYDDFRGEKLEEYLCAITLRLMLIRDLLGDSGTVWVHLDRRVAHYVRVIMDMIYGSGNFINEIIWTYKSGGASGRSFARKHDNLLVYGKTGGYKFHPLKEKSYNRDMKPYHFKGVEEFQDEKGWYTKVNMRDVWQLDMVGRTSGERQGYATQKPEKLMERIVLSCSDQGDLCADFYGGSGSFAAVCDRMGRRWLSCDDNPAAVTGQIQRLQHAAGGFRVNCLSCWPEGRATVSDGSVTAYAADVNAIVCNDGAALDRYMKEDGLCFLRLVKTDADAGGEYIIGYDLLGNSFKEYID